jgi:hypothetical protein
VDKKRLNWVTIGFTALALLVISMMLMNTIRRPAEIKLPDVETSSDQATENPNQTSATLNVIEITPDTVQSAVETLSRPGMYQRTITVEQFWSGGSGSYDTTVTVNGPWTRTDRIMPDGRVRHCISGTNEVYIWYNNEHNVYAGSVGDVSADNEQSIPTYEDILDLQPDQIVVSDYLAFSEINCIYVEAVFPDHYTLRYWVSVDTGLLVAAEKLFEQETIYRMGALALDLTEPSPTSFTLPDGTNLL